MTDWNRTDISSPRHKADPFPFYAHLRAHSPVHPLPLRDGRTAWLITRYDDAVTAFKDARLAKDKWSTLSAGQLQKEPWVPKMFKPLARNMLDLDGADHARLRALVHRAFTPGLVEHLRPRVDRLAAELLARARHRRRFDVIRDYALPIPTTVIAEILGVPAGDAVKFHRWTTAIVTATPSTVGMIRIFPYIWAFMRYIRRLVQSKRTSPQDDLLSRLVQAESMGDRLSEDELLAMAFLLLIAGHETTVNLIGNGMLALLQHRSQLDRLRENSSLLDSAIEEMLRFSGPVETATERYAREDITMAGHTIPRGAFVLIAIASANRDADQFENPDTFDLSRDPNRHLGFGLGIHYCVGAPLARLEAQIAFTHLLDSTRDIRLALPDDRLPWRRGLVLRGLTSLPVTPTWR